MAQHLENRLIDDAVELLKVNGFDGLANAVTVLLNAAMVAERSDYLGAAPYERSASRVGYANGYKDKRQNAENPAWGVAAEGATNPRQRVLSAEPGTRAALGTCTAIGHCGEVRAGCIDAACEEDR